MTASEDARRRLRESLRDEPDGSRKLLRKLDAARADVRDVERMQKWCLAGATGSLAIGALVSFDLIPDAMVAVAIVGFMFTACCLILGVYTETGQSRIGENRINYCRRKLADLEDAYEDALDRETK